MTQLTASVETETGYRFMNMMVNSSEIKDGDVFTVSGPMVVTANYVEKKDLASLIDKTTQTVVYNKQYRNFEVKITGYSGLDFKVAYSRSGVEMTENPKSAGTYKVRLPVARMIYLSRGCNCRADYQEGWYGIAGSTDYRRG